MEYFSAVSAFSKVKMLVLPSIFRVAHSSLKTQTGPRSFNAPLAAENESPNAGEKKRIKVNRHHTLREHPKLSKVPVKSHSTDNVFRENAERVFSDNVHEGVTVSQNINACALDSKVGDVDAKVIPSAKGLLETNLDDLFSDIPEADSLDTKSCKEHCIVSDVVGDLPPVEYKRESLLTCSTDYECEDGSTDSDSLDNVVQTQRKCLGARRFGHMLRRVISRNATNGTSVLEKLAEFASYTEVWLNVSYIHNVNWPLSKPTCWAENSHKVERRIMVSVIVLSPSLLLCFFTASHESTTPE
ncbi:hypothetical protein EVAR_76372_1 [Eumeta japonica]|uniref:Uncharacterized protein n=1 Tax=Eumeta variegata TaxID=151549 RepID=A0A4C1T8Q9_EUMVA|nr:hypothetical protein EVAR_76372_1 [Eumeta japonica]